MKRTHFTIRALCALGTLAAAPAFGAPCAGFTDVDTVDADGVALAAVQALAARDRARAKALRALEARNAAREATVQALMEVLARRRTDMLD